MRTCKFCEQRVSAPCYTEGELRYHGGHYLSLPRCKDALKKHDAAEKAAAEQHPEEDTFTVGKEELRRVELSDTAKAQIATAGLAPSAAPTPFEWGLMQENAARGIPATPFMQALQRGDIPTVSKTEGVKFDDGKLRFDLIPPDAMAVVAAVLTYGALKYDDRNWELGMDRARLRAARARHENARALGQATDPETGLPHLAHEAACTLMELALHLRDKGTDSGAKFGPSTLSKVQHFANQAVEAGRIAAAKKAAHHG